MCIWFIFDMFINDSDIQDFVFKDVTNFFLDGSYGCFVHKNNRKKIVQDFIDFIESKKDDIFPNKHKIPYI